MSHPRARLCQLVLVTPILLISTQLFALAPAVLTATTSGATVFLSWTPVPGATGYALYYAPSPYTGPESVRSLLVGSQTSFAATLPDGTSFLVAVTARNGAEESTYSNVVLVGGRAPGGTPTASLVNGGIVLSYGSYSQVFPNGLPTAPGLWNWEKVLSDLDQSVDVGAYDFVLLWTKTALPGSGSRINSGAPVRSPEALNAGMDERFTGRRYSIRDFGPRLKSMPFYDTLDRAPNSITIFHEIGHYWPVAPAYRVIDRSTWNAATDPVAWLATSCDPQGHWCGPWYSSQTSAPLQDAPGLMAYGGGKGLRFNPFDLYVMGIIGYGEVSAATYFVEAPPGPTRPSPVRYPITQDSIIASRRLRADGVYYVKGDGRRIPDTDPAMGSIRALVVVIKQDNETLTSSERAMLTSLTQRLPTDWLTATWGRSLLTLPLLFRPG